MSLLNEVLRVLGTSLVLRGVVWAVVAVALAIGALWLARPRVVRWLGGLDDASGAPSGAGLLLTLFAVMVLCMLGGIQALAVAGYMLGIGMNAAHLPLAFVLSVGLGFAAARGSCTRAPVKVWLAAVALLVVASAVSLALAGSFYDVSWDGNATYQPAVVKLANGWNPMIDEAALPPEAGADFWIQSYPKGSWVDAASVYAVTGRIEQAKAPKVLALLAAFSASCALALTLAPERWRLGLLLAAIAAFNPITVVQLQTFMYDGEVASLLLAWMALAGLLWTQRGRWPVLAALAATTVMLATIKYTALLYVVILVCALAVVAMRRRPACVRSSAVIWVPAMALLIGVLLVGYNPYVTNTVRHGSPFYPVMGGDSLDLMVAHMPGNFADHGALGKLGLSLFSRSADVGAYGPGSSTTFKVPLTVVPGELRAFSGPTARVAGFGPWFGAAVLLWLALVVGMAGDSTARRAPELRLVALCQLAVLVTVLVNPEAWWARYVPQLWLMPLLAGGAALVWGTRTWHRRIGAVVLGVLLVDALMVGGVNATSQIYATTRIESALGSVRSLGHPVRLQQREFTTTYLKLEGAGIAYTIIPDDAADANGVTIPYLDSVVYP